MLKTLKIGELADKAGVTTRTIRYYEEIDLIKPCSHSSKGYRLYNQTTLDRLNFIRHLKDLDFSLEEISRIIKNIDNCQTGSELAEFLKPLMEGSELRAEEKIKGFSRVKENMMQYYHAIKNDVK